MAVFIGLVGKPGSANQVHPGYATVLARARAAVALIEAGMAWAQRTGVLHEFNQEYRRQRLAAVEERFTSYQ